jgi:ribosome recycling factor
VEDQHVRQQRRWKHNKGAKLGQHLQTLDELAHRTEHQAAQERHKKEKERRAQHHKKEGKEPASAETEEEPHEQEEEELDETILPDPQQVEQKMQKHVIRFKDYLKGIRGGEPTPELLDEIAVTDAYGKGTGVTSLKALAQVVVPSPTLAVATCFDPATAKAVANAIRIALGADFTNPQIEDGVVHVPLPRVSLESRQSTVRTVHQRAEQFRKRVNQTRNKAITVTKQGMAGRLEHVSKDDAFRIHEAIEKAKDAALLEINAMADKKADDILKL